MRSTLAHTRRRPCQGTAHAESGGVCARGIGVRRNGAGFLAGPSRGGNMLNNRTPKKRAVNLFVDTELLDEARRMRVNLSETLEGHLRTIVRAEQERRWLQENRQALDA